MSAEALVESGSGAVDYRSFTIPESTRHADVRKAADALTVRLAQNPHDIAPLGSFIDEQMFLAQAEETPDRREAIHALLETTEQMVDRYPWNSAEQHAFTPQAAQTLLRMLPTLDKKTERESPRHRQILHRIAGRILEGYMNDRFVPTHNWRGALATYHTVVEGALLDPTDTMTLGVFVDLWVGKRPKILKPAAIGRRSVFLGFRAANPRDEDLVALAQDIDVAAFKIAKFLDRFDQYRTNSLSYQPLVEQLSRAIAELKLGRIKTPVPADLAEIASDAVTYQERFAAMQAVIAHGFGDTIGGNAPFMAIGSQMGSQDALAQFPYSVLLRSSPIKDGVDRFIDATVTRDTLYREAQEYADSNVPAWRVIPFAVGNIRGYAIVPPYVALTHQGQLNYALDKALTYSIESVWTDQAPRVNPTQLVGVTILRRDIKFVLSPQRFATAGELETMCDAIIPDRLRIRSMEHLEAVMTLRRQIPQQFTRSLTRGGDQYELDQVEGLGDFVNRVTLRLSHPAGGFAFDIELRAPQQFSSQFRTLGGTIDFAGDMANIHFQTGKEAMPADVEWLLGHVVLRLLRESCCGGLSEDRTEAAPRSSVDAEPTDRETPGRIVHIGVHKKSGAPGEPTETAEENYQRAMDLLRRETAGISLATISAFHGRAFPDCRRNLTWRIGREPTERVGLPAIRQTPPDLLVLQ